MGVLRAESALTFGSPTPASLGSFMSTAERVRLPDDCTVGYIVEGLLGARLLPSSLFHSHLENLQRLPPDAVLRQVQPTGCSRTLAPLLPSGAWPFTQWFPGCPGLRGAFPAPHGGCCRP